MREFIYNDKKIDASQTILCGIINATPDSFSDGGRYLEVENAVKRAKDLIGSGCKMLDIGGESTRPGSTYVQIQEEINRVVPVIKALKEITDLPLSVDTWKADVAEAAIEAGADIINDITGFVGDKRMAEVVGKSRAGAILMFNPVIARPNNENSKIFPSFGGQGVFSANEIEQMENMPIEEAMVYYLRKSINIAKEAGIEDARIMLDPGIGFGLTRKENLLLFEKSTLLHDMGYMAFVGVSRKRFLVSLLEENNKLGDDNLSEKDMASSFLTALAAYKGYEVLRVHTSEYHDIGRIVGDSLRLNENMEDRILKRYE